MKTKSILVSFLSAAILLACSGSKKEAHEGHDTAQPAESATVAAEIKVFDNVDPSVKSQLTGFLSDYLAMNQSLIEDNHDGAKAAAKKLSETVSKFDMSKLEGEQMAFYHIQEAKLNSALTEIGKASDIEETRVELAGVSEAMYSLVKAYHANDTELYYQYCPMALNNEGANWLSSTKEIINPYMGQRMLKCGKTQETL
ncbi:MAG: DUF3347 domain-containing protein [Cyclobacteriaceae bacterium]|nr:DUF3347 domain-containing protein [Cyclobacteriaceae bacterium]